jgi:hypothetical protein
MLLIDKVRITKWVRDLRLHVSYFVIECCRFLSAGVKTKPDENSPDIGHIADELAYGQR